MAKIYEQQFPKSSTVFFKIIILIVKDCRQPSVNKLCHNAMLAHKRNNDNNYEIKSQLHRYDLVSINFLDTVELIKLSR